MKTTTLVYVFNTQGQILLCSKKSTNSGFTVALGKRNGPGGKIDDDETPQECAQRELEEEVGIQISLSQLEYAGYIDFQFPTKPERTHDNHIFIVRNYNGEVYETEEMLPKWRDIKDIPYHNMREDDILRMPKMLAGEIINETYYLDQDGKLLEEVHL